MRGRNQGTSEETIELRLPDETVWTYPGKWFRDFIELGKRMAGRQTLEEQGSERALLVVPRRDLVAVAIGLGMSIQKFAERHSLSKKVSVEDLAKLEPGTQIRVSWPGKTRDAVFLGLDTGRDPWRISLQIDGERPRQYGMRNVEISIVHIDTPMGEKSAIGFASDPLAMPEAGRSFHNQISPAGSFFSEGSFFEGQLATEIRWDSLDSIFPDQTVHIQQAARFDYLENDEHPHFVNVFALARRLNDLKPPEIERVRACDWVILDGNTALGHLSTSEHLCGKRVLGIMDASNTVMQEQAFQSFAAEAGRLWREDIDRVWGWRPPIGTLFWSWGRNES